MRPLRVCAGLPGEHIYKRAGGSRGRPTGTWQPRRLGLCLDVARATLQNSTRQIPRGRRLRHDGIGQADPEGFVDPQEQLDALETADAEVAVEQVVRARRHGDGRTAELSRERGHDPEDASFDRRA
jgi:hypothetical protein